MKEASLCENMLDIREAIDNIDEQIVKLIAQRAKYVHKASEFKKDEEAVKDKQRVQKVIESKKQLAKDLGASPELTEILYSSMIEFFINEEMNQWKKNKEENK